MLAIRTSLTSTDNRRPFCVCDARTGRLEADCLTQAEAHALCSRVNLRLAVEAYERAERVADLLGTDPGKLADQLYIELTRQAIACGFPWSSNQTVLAWAKAYLAAGTTEGARS